jgi:hypothetical protein
MAEERLVSHPLPLEEVVDQAAAVTYGKVVQTPEALEALVIHHQHHLPKVLTAAQAALISRLMKIYKPVAVAARVKQGKLVKQLLAARAAMALHLQFPVLP